MKLLNKLLRIGQPRQSKRGKTDGLLVTRQRQEKGIRKHETSSRITFYKGFSYEETLPNMPLVTTPSTETKVQPSDTVQDPNEEYEIEVLPEKQDRKLKKRKIIEQPPPSTKYQTWMEKDTMQDLKGEAPQSLNPKGQQYSSEEYQNSSKRKRNIRRGADKLPSSSLIVTRVWPNKMTPEDQTSRHYTFDKGFSYEETLPNVPFDTTKSTEEAEEDEIEVVVEALETEKPSKWQKRKTRKVRFIDDHLAIETPPCPPKLAWIETGEVPVVQRKQTRKQTRKQDKERQENTEKEEIKQAAKDQVIREQVNKPSLKKQIGKKCSKLLKRYLSSFNNSYLLLDTTAATLI